MHINNGLLFMQDKGILPFMVMWMGLGILREICQVQKDKYCQLHNHLWKQTTCHSCGVGWEQWSLGTWNGRRWGIERLGNRQWGEFMLVVFHWVAGTCSLKVSMTCLEIKTWKKGHKNVQHREIINAWDGNAITLIWSLCFVCTSVYHTVTSKHVHILCVNFYADVWGQWEEVHIRRKHSSSFRPTLSALPVGTTGWQAWGTHLQMSKL